MARALGVTDRGHLALFMLIPQALTHLGTLGVPLALTYFVSRHPHHGRVIGKSALGLGAMQVTPLLAVHFIVVMVVMSSERPDVRIAGLASIVILPVGLAQQYGLALLQGQQRFRQLHALRLLGPALYSAAIVTLILFDKGQLLPITVAWVISYFIAGVMTMTFAMRTLPATTQAHASIGRRQLLRFGVTGLLGSASPIERFRIDQAVVGFLLSPAALGLYVVGMAFTHLIVALGHGIALVAYPRVAATDDEPARRRVVWRFFALGVAICGVAFGSIELAAGWLVPFFFGEEFAEAIPITRILLVAALFLALRRVLMELARGAGKPGIGTIAEIAAWITLLPALAVLMPNWGLPGVAWAVVISSCVSVCVVIASVASGGSATTRAPDRHQGSEEGQGK